jgi:hypothetical protein
MPTALWTGTLSLGLSPCPFRLIPATEPKDAIPPLRPVRAGAFGTTGGGGFGTRGAGASLAEDRSPGELDLINAEEQAGSDARRHDPLTG